MKMRECLEGSRVSCCTASLHGGVRARRAAASMDGGVVRRGAEGGDPRAIGWGRQRELQSPKGASGPRGATRTESTTPTRRERAARRKRAREDGAGMGARRSRWLLHTRHERCRCRGRYIEYTAAIIENDHEMGMPGA